MYVDSGLRRHADGRLGLDPAVERLKDVDIELLTEDQALATAGATPSATVGTGANTTWLMATVVFSRRAVRHRDGARQRRPA